MHPRGSGPPRLNARQSAKPLIGLSGKLAIFFMQVYARNSILAEVSKPRLGLVRSKGIAVRTEVKVR